MSGGSWDYLYCKVREAGDLLILEGTEQNNALRVKLGQHLQLVADALHDIEWVDSGDYSTGQDDGAIKAVLGVSLYWTGFSK